MSSLAPALVIAGLRLLDAQRCLSVSLLVAGGVAFGLTPLVLALRRKAGRQELNVANVKDESAQVPTYLLTFVFPFLFLSGQMGTSMVIAYVVFALFMALLLYRTPLALINPAMLVVGLRVFSVEVAGQGAAYIISRDAPLPSAPTCVKRVAEGLYLAVEPESRTGKVPARLSMKRKNGQTKG
ncbi:hypothetical protein CGZ98_07715 [Enemella evansiae]|nr:hypothetical protein CGZ98_07715 [Enemella evansiae]